MKLVEMILNEEAMANGVNAISLVADPAIKSNFIALSAIPVQFATVNAEKRIVLGAVLIPDLPILRKDESGKPYHIFFSKETIRKAAELFLKRGNQNSTTLEHAVKLEGVSVVESWLVDNPEMDKAKHHGIKAKEGQWMSAMKIDSDDVWEDYVKSGKVKGFSIEGHFIERTTLSATPCLTAKIIRKQ
jgi:hypothetical protein